VPGEDIGLDSIITLSAEHLSANLDDELVLLNPRTARYHAVHGPGNQIFQLLAQPRTVRELCDAMTARFEVADDICQRDVLDFVRALIREELAVAT
jgi:Coenzyme PQQ synthesis protein D (PqqD)